MRLFKNVPVYPVFFAVFSVLSLYARNIIEVEAALIVRPLLFAFTACILLYGILYLILHSWEKAAILASFLFLLFNTYGFVYQFFERVPGLSGILGRHRYLVVIYVLGLALGIYLIAFRLKSPQNLMASLMVMGLFLVGYPLVEIGISVVQGQISRQAGSALVAEAGDLNPPDREHLPDVYLIVLDSYARTDAILRDFGYDNSYFTIGLQEQGFYVAECSRSNYGYTQESLTSTLNMDYLDSLSARLAQIEPPSEDITVLIKQSMVREQLERLGYETVAFETGYDWTTLSDVDIYLSVSEKSAQVRRVLKPFEAMYINSTALLLLSDALFHRNSDDFYNPNYPYYDHIGRELYLLDQLPRISEISETPKFIFAHVLIPHVPFVFKGDGGIFTDEGFFSGEKASPINDAYRAEGYTNQVEFISKAMLGITAEILARSSKPPIIVIMGDHGYIADHRYEILNAYYLPGEDYSGLSASITPVNTFRVIFDQYFGGTYELLPDVSLQYMGGEAVIVQETNPACIVP